MSSINYPFVTEKAMMLLDENKLQFIVDTRSNKKQIVEDVRIQSKIRADHDHNEGHEKSSPRL
jgi:ribosomal protein L23